MSRVPGSVWLAGMGCLVLFLVFLHSQSNIEEQRRHYEARMEEYEARIDSIRARANAYAEAARKARSRWDSLRRIDTVYITKIERQKDEIQKLRNRPVPVDIDDNLRFFANYSLIETEADSTE